MNDFFNVPNQPNVQVCPPIVNRHVVVCHRYNIIEQPHICEIHTKIINHTTSVISLFLNLHAARKIHSVKETLVVVQE